MCLITSSITVAGVTISAAMANIMAGIAAAGALSGIAGSALSGIASNQQAKQQKAMYNYQAQVAQQNAKIADNNAKLERQQGIEETRLQRMKTLQHVGSQQTAMAANGIDITQGTPLDVIEDTAAMGELDALQTRYNYERKALAYEAQSDNFLNQANLDVIAGKNAYSAAKLNGLASGLDGVSKMGSVASKWLSMGNTTANNGFFVSGGIKGDNYLFA